MKHLSPFAYYGGKGRIIDFVLRNLPSANRLVDLFGGSGVVAINASFRYKRVVYNDINSDIVNFFRVLRRHPDELIEQIVLTPVSREEYDDCFGDPVDDIDAARRLFVRVTQSFASVGAHVKAGWSAPTKICRSSAVQKRIDMLQDIVNILRTFDIENKDWRWVVSKYGDSSSLIFADPPYDLSVRKGRVYRNEFIESDHRDLAIALMDSQAKAVVCGYRSELYDEIYSGWKRVDKDVVCLNANGLDAGRVESMWIKA